MSGSSPSDWNAADRAYQLHHLNCPTCIARQVAGFDVGQEVSGLCSGVVRARRASQVSSSIRLGEHRAGQLVAQAEAQQRRLHFHLRLSLGRLRLLSSLTDL